MQKKFVSNLPVFVATALAAANLAAAQQSSGSCQNGNNANCRPAKTFNQGEQLAAGQMPAAYNAPARIDVRGSWDLFVDASYILWQPSQDNMEFAAGASAGNANVTGNVSGQSTLYNLNPSYKSGFKVGAGVNFDHDDWTNWAEYTWFHNSSTRSVSDTVNTLIAPVLLHPGASQSGAATAGFTGADAKWRLRMDLVDWALGRSYYVGQSLTFLPYTGLRAAWIRQSYITQYNSATVAATDAKYQSHSWGLGLEAGLEANWLLGMGFSLFSEVEADLLYTRYKTSSQIFSAAAPTTQRINTKETGINTVRPHMDMDLGVRYGTYFDNQNWHVDLKLGYGFQVFWNQNMFTRFSSANENFASLNSLGNLYVQGMTFTARLDF